MKLLSNLSKLLAAASAIWAVAAIAYFLFFAQVTIESVTISATQGQPETTVPTIEHQNWAVYAGASGAAAVLAFALLLVAGAYAAWRGRLAVLALLAVLSLVASFITGFSIGGAFLPGALALSLSAVFAALDRLLQRSRLRGA